ncbi:glycoside hydrolase family 25 protein [Streptomyces sp. NPDC005791]|uniref:glycoside hydrolase family 25 protein n=1 Tax=unclassified Streptomyces TaxID=2593676 RepID=UPI0033C58B47
MSVVRITPTAAKSRMTGLRRAAVRTAVVAASTAVVVTGLTAMPSEAAPPGKYRVKGVDTSHYSHPGGRAVDWRRVRAAGHSFVIAKATEGATERDSWFARDLEGAKRAGLVRGAYHFYAGTPGAAQAENFVQAMKGARYTGKAAGELPPTVDLELKKNACPKGFGTGQLRDFLQVLTGEVGVRPIVYTTKQFVDRCMDGDGSLLEGHTLWQPRYRSGSREPDAVPGAGSGWTIWQHSEQGSVPGIPSRGRTDLNVFRGTLAELKRRAHLPAG